MRSIGLYTQNTVNNNLDDYVKTPSVKLYFNDVVLYGIDYKLGGRKDIKLFHQVMFVCLHSSDADEKFVGNLFIAQTQAHMLEYFKLSF